MAPEEGAGAAGNGGGISCQAVMSLGRFSNTWKMTLLDLPVKVCNEGAPEKPGERRQRTVDWVGRAGQSQLSNPGQKARGFVQGSDD
jgi:hypothetical protein